ncbi:MAG: transglycosylase domain-containing protein [Clostridiales bacterium]|nr:transglycosylase domain-containing protein [Clostridiales bacterium]
MARERSGVAGSVFSGILKWILMVLGTLLLIGAATAAILAVYAASYVQSVVVPEAEEANAALSLVRSDTDLTSAIYYYDESTGTYQTEETLYQSENRVWVSYEDIPQNLINATVAIEDKRFWEHNGVDWTRTAAAAFYMLTGQRQEGGSTITQQLIKNLTNNTETTVKRKVLEIFEALEFDSTHTKEETLEWYLNKIYLGSYNGTNCYGIYTAAQTYFGKDLEDLSLAECAALISITNNPSAYNPSTHPENNLRRRCLVLDQMCEQGYITEEERDAAKAEELVLASRDDTEEEEETTTTSGDYYSWYTETVISAVISDLMEEYDLDSETASQLIYSGGLKIYSCLDPEVQAAVDEVYTDSDTLSGHRSDGGQDLWSSIVVIDNDTGAVVAVSNASGEKTGNRVWNVATQTLRPPGSAIKPLSVYAPALEMGLVTPDSLLEDSQIRLSDGTLYPTSNSGKAPTGNLVTVEYGLQESLNTIAVQLLQRVSIQYSFNFLQERFGITSLVEERITSSGKYKSDLDFGPLALGGLTDGVSVYEMAAAYAVFARDGIYVEPYVYTIVTNSEGEVILSQDGYSITYDANGSAIITGYTGGEAVLKESTVQDMDDMLQNVVENGTGEDAQIEGVTVAGKTGTTNDDFDRWFVGYTDKYTAAVWSGYEYAETINYEEHRNPSVDMWREVMELIN